MRNKYTAILFVLASILLLPSAAHCQTQSIDPLIARALADIRPAPIKRDVARMVSFGTRHTLSSMKSKTSGVGAAAQFINAEFAKAAKKSNGRMTTELWEFDPRTVARAARLLNPSYDGHPLVNVIARLKGSDPTRVLIVSGHYDSRASKRLDITSSAPGANDDASGTAAVMEMARALSTVQTRASIWFVAFTGEEMGLWGSTALANFCREKGVKVEGMITNDIIGCALDAKGQRDASFVRCFSRGRPAGATTQSESDSPSRQMARYLQESARAYVPKLSVRLVFRQDRFLRGGDHRPFNNANFRGIRLTEPRENYLRQHQDVRTVDGKQLGDLPQFLDYGYIARVAQVNAAALLSLAMGPAPVERVQIDISRLMNETRLKWRRSPDPLITGYRVLMRLTHEANWTRSKNVGLVRDVTLVESKDDYLFAVQAVDKQGHCSLPVFATVR
jgi:hypothetical protein